MESNFEVFRHSLTQEGRARVDELKQQVIDAHKEPIVSNEMVYDITDFEQIWNDDDFIDLSMKKELFVTATVVTILVASLISLKLLSSR